MKMKIAHLDLECSNLNADWGVIICACIKWDGGKIDTFRMTDYKQKDLMDDSGVSMGMRDALNEADMWTGWYSSRFDIPYLQSRLLYHEKAPVASNIPHMDLWRTSRYQLKLSSNRLVNIERFLKLDAGKTPIDQGTWIRAIAGNKLCMRTVVKHCQEDVKLLEEAYHKLLPLIKGHPNIELFNPTPSDTLQCPKCGSHNMNRGGTLVTKTRRYQRWRCLECGSWSSSRLAEKVVNPPLKA